MKKLDKEALAENIVIEFLGYKNKEEIPKWILVELFPKYKQFYEKGLEYGENYYLKLIEEKDKEYDALESMWLAEKGINKLIQQKLQQAKELLKKFYWDNVKEYDKEIEEFLNQ